MNEVGEKLQALRSRASRALAQDDNAAAPSVLTPLIPSPFGPHPLSPSPPCGEGGRKGSPSFPLSTFVERGTGGEDYGEGDGGEDREASELVILSAAGAKDLLSHRCEGPISDAAGLHCPLRAVSR